MIKRQGLSKFHLLMVIILSVKSRVFELGKHHERIGKMGHGCHVALSNYPDGHGTNVLFPVEHELDSLVPKNIYLIET